MTVLPLFHIPRRTGIGVVVVVTQETCLHCLTVCGMDLVLQASPAESSVNFQTHSRDLYC